jgi:hypothetical protein
LQPKVTVVHRIRSLARILNHLLGRKDTAAVGPPPQRLALGLAFMRRRRVLGGHEHVVLREPRPVISGVLPLPG